MAKIEKREGEITLIYNSDKLDDRHALNYLKSIANKVNEIDTSKEKLSESQVKFLASEMNSDVEALIDENNRLLLHEVDNGNLKKDSLVKLLSLRPDFLKTPVTIWNDTVEHWDSAYEIIKFQMDYHHH